MKCNTCFEYIETNQDWQTTVLFLKQASKIAIDLESNGMHAYFEKICLLQFAANGKSFIVDPVAIGAGKELGEILEDPKIEKIFHSCDYDVRSIERDYKIKMENLFDTSIAAQFLGSERLGLGNVIFEYLNVELEKSKKIQQMNWGLRPLPAHALKYAVDDVLYLEDLRDILVDKLQNLGRLGWVKEECDRMLGLKATLPAPASESFKKIKGNRVLDASQMAILREVNIARDTIACEKNRPPFKIMHNSTMIELAQNPNVKISDIKGMNKGVLIKYEQLLKTALEKGIESEPVIIPKKKFKSPWKPKSLKIFNKLKEWRKAEAEKLSLTASVIWPMISLERIALDSEARESELAQAIEVRDWQKEVFGQAIVNLDVY